VETLHSFSCLPANFDTRSVPDSRRLLVGRRTRIGLERRAREHERRASATERYTVA
jgi:hypothetical protein